MHILPDGRRINYGKNGVTIGATPINLAGRSGRTPGASANIASGHAYTTSTSALTTSLYRSDGQYSFEDRQHHLGRQPSIDNGLPTLDSAYSTSNYGSPRDDDRFGLGLSPVNGKGLSVLDAPLPASFDSNGISNAARFPAAPWPSSVPSKFGPESPSTSLGNAKDARTSETLKLLHSSAFGSSEHLATPTASSPPTQYGNTEEYFGRRAMHSSRYAKPKMLSSSMPKTSVDRDWEAEFAFGDDSGDNLPENYVPENLQDLLTPAEKARRGSMRADDESPAFAKYGVSPIGTSPSRWGPLFQKQKDEDENLRSSRGGPSAFGHVGSPLRNSTLAQEMGDGLNGHRPSVLRSGSEGMSMLSQQLQRSRIDDNTGQASSPQSHLHPMSARNSNAMGNKDRMIERHVSSGSVSSNVTGRFTTPIDEEDPAFVFSMEEEEDHNAARTRKRVSGGLGMGFSSYAAAAVKGGKEVPVHRR